ncbi:uncharacterized protein HD556DRAFT_1314893 [Suillus plorans]|uniref:Myb/SANT-like domain-containing protein n=1 Tax=Suillus plorans TaxID=116603 RepID=A0A9P7A8U4_9AGAM|nr:uncharacterized protein HD556DRAFT_1314893 [Suillus plorans]KAG1784645.1 hypothetical protein HD556DRAFT_1314893 [Suillus plorans]
MAQPEAHHNTMKSQPAHWINEEITVLVNHMHDHRTDSEGSGNFKPQVYTSAVTAINDDPHLQPIWIGPAKTIKMLKTIHYAIDKYRNQTGTHWDNINGAGIHGSAAAAVWDAYVANKLIYNSIIILCVHSATLGGAQGCHAFHPSVMGPPPSIPNNDEVKAGPYRAPANRTGPTSTASLFSTTGPSSTTGVPSVATSSTSAKHPYEGTTIDSLETRSLTSTHESAQSVSTTLVSAPPLKIARSQGGTYISKKTSNTAKMSSATQAAKIIPAAAVLGMQGTINHLTDVFERFVQGLNEKGGMQLLPPPPPGPGNSQDLVVCAVHLLQIEDADMPPEQHAVLIMVLGEKNNERFLEFYVSLTDKATRCPSIEKLITDAMAS